MYSVVGRETALGEVTFAVHSRYFLAKGQGSRGDRGCDNEFLCQQVVLGQRLAADSLLANGATFHIALRMSTVVVGAEVQFPLADFSDVIGIHGMFHPRLQGGDRLVGLRFLELTVTPHLLVSFYTTCRIGDIVVGGVGQSERMFLGYLPVPAEVGKIVVKSHVLEACSWSLAVALTTRLLLVRNPRAKKSIPLRVR